LGEGEFGRVVKGFAIGINGKIEEQTVVAVKMLKTGANSVEFEALWKEFQSLQEVSHPNVVRLLGACTRDGTPLLILEYCQFGSLWNYLRTSRNLDSVAIEYENGVEPMTVKDILSFAWQICKGMSYLAENRVISTLLVPAISDFQMIYFL
jgi:proto-oncogene tyrosine-protein kinase Ret